MFDGEKLDHIAKDDDKFTGLIRVHYWAYAMAGMGDGGTVGYLRVEADDFEIERIYRPKEVGGYFYKYTLNKKGCEKVKNAFNLIEMAPAPLAPVGWEFRDVNALEEEKECIRERIRKDKDLLTELENV